MAASTSEFRLGVLQLLLDLLIVNDILSFSFKKSSNQVIFKSSGVGMVTLACGAVEDKVAYVNDVLRLFKVI